MEKWVKIAGDYHAPFCKNYLFVKGFIVQSELLGTKQVLIGVRGFPKTIDYLELNSKNWEKAFHKFSKIVDDDIGVLEKILNKTIKIGEEMNNFTEKLTKDNLTNYSAKKVIEVYQQHGKYDYLTYAWGTQLALLDFANYHYLEDKVGSILKLKLDLKEALKAFTVFTQPTEDSFFLEQEKSILNIYKSISNKQIFKKEPEEIINKLKSNYPEIYQKLKEHTKKYAWIYYVYTGPALTEKDFVEIIISYSSKKINPEKKLNEFKKEREHLLKERKKYFRKLNLNAEEKRYVEIISRVIYLKPRRKDYQSKSYCHMEFLQKEIGRRLNLSLNQVRAMTLKEIKRGVLEKKKINSDKLNQRINFHIIIPKGKTIKFYSGEKAKSFSKKYIKEEKSDFKKINRIEAKMAYPGHVKGRVKRIDMPEDMGKMEEGDILVSTATTPSIVPAIRKAAAIVTDEGGITCHAAIVSREFKIPCVVGTKIATKVLKDGDLVEVDANKGVVKVIK